MAELWYELVKPDVPLMQGDLIVDCPLIGWKDQAVTHSTVEGLQQQAEAFSADVVIMTQACDLEQEKVKNVVLCPHRSLDDYKRRWEEAMRTAEQSPSAKAWSKHCKSLCDGSLWNLAILNCASHESIETSHRVVDFHEVYTVPRVFLEAFLVATGGDRLRLLPPYREHLSQAFARFFMRVGLPTAIEVVW